MIITFPFFFLSLFIDWFIDSFVRIYRQTSSMPRQSGYAFINLKHSNNDVHVTLKFQRCALLRTPMKYVIKLFCWWHQSEACGNYFLSYNGLKMPYLDQKVFCMAYLNGILKKKTSFIWKEDWIEDFPKREDFRLKSQVKYSVAKELLLRTKCMVIVLSPAFWINCQVKYLKHKLLHLAMWKWYIIDAVHIWWITLYIYRWSQYIIHRWTT